MRKMQCRFVEFTGSIRAITLVMLLQPLAKAQAGPAWHLQQVIRTNSLAEAGKQPFHLKMSFQYNDMAGRPVETGILEEWWEAPGSSRSTITAPSLKTTEPLLLSEAVNLDPRERYFVNKLLAAELDPVPVLTPVELSTIREKPRTESKVRLTCLIFDTDLSVLSESHANFCADPANNVLRFETDGDFLTIARNSPNLFHDTTVAMDVQIVNNGWLAISGHVVDIRSLDHSDVKLSSQTSSEVGQSAEVTQPKVIKGGSIAAPDFMDKASAQENTGTVVLDLIVTRNGLPSGVFALSSPKQSLTDAAVRSVKQWKFEPATQEGRPVDCEIVVSTTFHSN